jgi:hypothetical protein
MGFEAKGRVSALTTSREQLDCLLHGTVRLEVTHGELRICKDIEDC